MTEISELGLWSKSKTKPFHQGVDVIIGRTSIDSYPCTLAVYWLILLVGSHRSVVRLREQPATQYGTPGAAARSSPS